MGELRTLFFALIAGGIFCLVAGKASGPPSDHTITWVVSGVILFLFSMIIGVLIHEDSKRAEDLDVPEDAIKDDEHNDAVAAAVCPGSEKNTPGSC